MQLQSGFNSIQFQIWQHSCGYDRMVYPELGSVWKISGIASTWGSVRFCGIGYFCYFLTLVFRQLINCLIQTQLNGLWIETLKECQIKCNKTCKRNDQWTVFSTLQQCMKVESYNVRGSKRWLHLFAEPTLLFESNSEYIFQRGKLCFFFWHQVSKERQLYFLCSNRRKGWIVCLELKCLCGAQE